MAVKKPPTTVPANSPYYYGGGGSKPTPPKVTQIPGYTTTVIGGVPVSTPIANRPDPILPPAPTSGAYDPRAYVPGGSSPAVAQAIQDAGFRNPGPNPIYVPDQPTWEAENPNAARYMNPLHVGGVAGWGSPEDFRNAITSQWDYGQLAGQNRNAGIVDAASKRSQYGALLNQWGGDLSGLVGEGLIGQDEASAASANPTSFMSTLTDALNRGQAKDILSLGSRGITDSGDIAVSKTNRLRDFQNESARGLGELKGKLGAISTGMSDRAAQRDQNLTSLYSDIAARLGQDPQYRKREAIPEETANWDGSAYVTPTGRRFDVNGNPV